MKPHQDLTLTPAEVRLVASLLELYDAAWNDFNPQRDRESIYITALERAGQHDHRTFDGLTLKVEPYRVATGKEEKP